MKQKPTPDQERAAWSIAVELHKLGIKPTAQGNWIVLKPPPPADLLMRIMELPEGLVEALLPQVVANSAPHGGGER